MSQAASRTVGILIFDDVEVLDFCGPFEVFAMARRPESPEDAPPPFHVLTIAQTRRTVKCRGGLLVEPHHTIEDHPPLDIVVVPGGMGTRREVHNAPVLDWIAAQSRTAELTTSVCTGAFLLAERGLLDGKRATTHWASVQRLREQYPAAWAVADARVVDEGSVVTSAGVSAGIDMALHVVARLLGDDAATWTARRMEYDWSARGQVVR